MWLDGFDSDHLWFLFAYVMGSVVTGVILYKTIYMKAISQTIDGLCVQGFLRFRKDATGEVEILPWNWVEEKDKQLAK